MSATDTVDWMRAEAEHTRTDLAYALRQLREGRAGGVQRALDALERVEECLQGIAAGGVAGDEDE